ncbi:MAG TPA: sigma-70 family RNA polymerase sigma factor [Bacteroidia bacterium]|nr:sigma-70 family RNA polymerase sigma factor [Bacteroidia bacterium]
MSRKPASDPHEQQHMLWLTGKKNYQSLDDKELIVIYRKKGDNSAMGALFERYSHLVFGVCMKYFKDEDTSKDATLQVFEKTMQDLKRFEIEKFSAWIHKVAKNHCLMQLRSKKIMIPVDDEEGIATDRMMGQGFSTSPEQTDNKEAQLSLLEEGISRLNEEQKICIELFYLKRYSYQDVSEISGMTLNEVKSHIQNGKRNLKIFMMNNTDEL